MGERESTESVQHGKSGGRRKKVSMAFMRVSPCLGAESAEASGVLADRSCVMDAGLLRHAHTSELPSPTVRVILHLCTV